MLELQYVVEMAAAAPPVPANEVWAAVPGLAVVRLRGHAMHAYAPRSGSAPHRPAPPAISPEADWATLLGARRARRAP